MYEFEIDVDLVGGEIEAEFGLRIGKEVSDTVFYDQQMDIQPSRRFEVEETTRAVWVSYRGNEPLRALRYLLVSAEAATDYAVPSPEDVRGESNGGRRKESQSRFKAVPRGCIRAQHRLQDLS